MLNFCTLFSNIEKINSVNIPQYRITKVTFAIDSSSTINCSNSLNAKGYESLNQDIRVSGKYKYVTLGWKKTEKGSPITNILGVVNKGCQNWNNFIGNDGLVYYPIVDLDGYQDINRGSKGAYICLFYTTGNYSNTYISEIKFISSGYAVYSVPEGDIVQNHLNSERSGPFDINSKRGGNYNYIILVRSVNNLDIVDENFYGSPSLRKEHNIPLSELIYVDLCNKMFNGGATTKFLGKIGDCDGWYERFEFNTNGITDIIIVGKANTGDSTITLNGVTYTKTQIKFTSNGIPYHLFFTNDKTQGKEIFDFNLLPYDNQSKYVSPNIVRIFMNELGTIKESFEKKFYIDNYGDKEYYFSMTK